VHIFVQITELMTESKFDCHITNIKYRRALRYCMAIGTGNLLLRQQGLNLIGFVLYVFKQLFSSVT